MDGQYKLLELAFRPTRDEFAVIAAVLNGRIIDGALYLYLLSP
jgi:hypothetical protein